jgi:tRNA(adenine34) deaminase
MSQTNQQDEKWMRHVLSLAKTAAKLNEVPIAAIVVDKKNRVVGSAFNQKETQHNACNHAEIMTIEKAGKTLKNWRLLDCTLYTNLEPCVMCAGAIYQSRIGRLVYAATDKKMGGVESVFQVLDSEKINHKTEWQSGILANESKELLSNFFKKRRK